MKDPQRDTSTRTHHCAAATAIALLALLLGCGNGDDGTLRASGHVEATDVRVSAEVGGTIAELPVEEGQTLDEGDLIAAIDTTDLQLQLRRARAERRLAAAELALLQAGYRVEDVDEAEARVDQAEAELAGAQRDLERFRGLLESGSGTEKARDDALTRHDAARARVRQARKTLDKLRSGFRPEEIEAARARVEAAEARIAQLEENIGDARVPCPVSGVVTKKVSEPGELVPAGTLLAVVTDLQDIWLNVFVSGPQLDAVRLGDSVTVVTDGGARREGTVSFIASEAEFTPRNVQTADERAKLVYRVKVRLPNDDLLFKPGMPAEAHFAAQGDERHRDGDGDADAAAGGGGGGS
jgi:HlyD family secretion protein